MNVQDLLALSLLEQQRALLLVVIVASAHYLLFNKRARKRRRRRELAAAGLMSTKKRCLRSSTLKPEHSDWAKFYDGTIREEREWMDWVGIPELAFTNLVNIQRNRWTTLPLEDEDGKPRPCDLKRRLLNCAGSLALYLYWMSHDMDYGPVGKMFGLLDTEAEKYIKFEIRILLPELRVHPHAQIYWPHHDLHYLKEMNDLFHLYVPELRNEFHLRPVAWLDGVRFEIVSKWSNPAAKKNDESGEKKLTLRKMQLLFDPRGKCVGAVWNLPGSWQDGKGCRIGLLYDLIDLLHVGYCILVDTNFQGRLIGGKLIRILKEGDYLPDGWLQAQVERLERLVTRGRQPSEWSNNQLVQYMVRLRSKLGMFDDFNGLLMELSILLYNYRVEYTDRNETKRFFRNLVLGSLDPAIQQIIQT